MSHMMFTLGHDNKSFDRLWRSLGRYELKIKHVYFIKLTLIEYQEPKGLILIITIVGCSKHLILMHPHIL
jgi:hypothetical protein